jgi:hypothetical protein
LSRSDTAADWLLIAATLLKLVETVILWKYISWKLSAASSISWLFFFIAAVMLEAMGISREFGDADSNSRSTDILAGDLPTIHGPGKELRIILHVPPNVRRHIAWLVVWGLGCLVCLSSTVTTYILLGGGSTTQFYAWGVFQALWLVLRSIFYHFAVVTDGRAYPVVEKRVADQRFRLLSLATAVSRHLAQVHPRTPESYLQDLQDPYELQSHFSASICKLNWQLGFGYGGPSDNERLASCQTGNFVDIDILAVIGDTMLASIAWIQGCDVSCLDLYDSCLVIFKIDNQTLLIPACRVLSGNAGQLKTPPADSESAGVSPQFVPKLGPCRGDGNGWVYWIPLGSDRWLYIVCGLDSLGEQRAEVLHSSEVTRRLMIGNLWVSLVNAEDVKTHVERSATVGGILMNCFLSDTREPRYPQIR